MLRCMSNFRQIRKDLFQVSQSEFGEIAGVTQATVSRWEAGISTPNLAELARIREAANQRGLSLSADDFFRQSVAPSEGAAA